MKDIKVISTENIHESVCKFIDETGTIIGDYDDMKDLVLTMIRAGYMFSGDRDRLRDAMEDITYMLCPDDDANRDRVEKGLEYDEEDGESDDEDEDDIRVEDVNESSTPRASDAADEPVVEDIGNTTDLQ
tara:strand:+ start:2093 stop:2482 length:390 start_codon:yes stop_codon:yes gene_type:complete